jgi:hypothetical protein
MKNWLSVHSVFGEGIAEEIRLSKILEKQCIIWGEDDWHTKQIDIYRILRASWDLPKYL